MGRPVKNILGNKYSRLLVIDYVEITKQGAVWKCKCDCGNIKNITSRDLVTNNTKSCGCYLNEMMGKQSIKHGETRKTNFTGTYKSWRSMKARCTNPNIKEYKNYGGRGIKFCERWNGYENFLKDMGERPKGYSLERKDPNGNYEPENCCWIPFNQQSRNTRKTVWVVLNGEKMIQADAAKILNRNPATICEWRNNPQRIPKDVDFIFLT
jgi:hypothetical protein